MMSTLPQPKYTQVDVIDYGGGNVGSLLRTLERLNIPYQLFAGGTTVNPFPTGENPIILPGVGAFEALMQALHTRGHVAVLNQLVQHQKVPFLGVCVGLQVLFEGSEEASDSCQGLGFLKGNVVKFTQGKVPQIGWNYVNAKQAGWQEGFVYYVNSYYAAPEDASAVLFESAYEGTAFCGAVAKDNITAFPFHPEKSGEFGQALLAHWWERVNQAEGSL
jgi:imidazole glycerol phosphate synthase glutamine amidotransferase subunit